MKQTKSSPFFIFLLAVLLVSCSGQTAVVTPNNPYSVHQTKAVVNTAVPEESPLPCRPTQGEMVTIGTAKLFIEYNATDEDMGVHGAFDDAGWSELCVYAPDGIQVLAVKTQSQLQDLTMASIFFESREPHVSEFSFADLRNNFPEDLYGGPGHFL